MVLHTDAQNKKVLLSNFYCRVHEFTFHIRVPSFQKLLNNSYVVSSLNCIKYNYYNMLVAVLTTTGVWEQKFLLVHLWKAEQALQQKRACFITAPVSIDFWLKITVASLGVGCSYIVKLLLWSHTPNGIKYWHSRTLKLRHWFVLSDDETHIRNTDTLI